MDKVRTRLSQKVRQSVLREFNHRCALCASDRPQLHHIDEDPANNAVSNLLPLCPNCHLRDQHDPTARFDPARLALFRKYRDPVILSPQFLPLYTRLSFLLNLRDPMTDNPAPDYDAYVDELIEFVQALNMGDFYAKRLKLLLLSEQRALLMAFGVSYSIVHADSLSKRRSHYSRLLANRESAEKLLMEIIHYQPWPNPYERKLGS